MYDETLYLNKRSVSYVQVHVETNKTTLLLL